MDDNIGLPTIEFTQHKEPFFVDIRLPDLGSVAVEHIDDSQGSKKCSEEDIQVVQKQQEQSSTSSAETSILVNYLTVNTEKRQCTECKHRANTDQEIISHLSNVHKKHVFRCAKCDYYSTNVFNFNKHGQEHRTEPVKKTKAVNKKSGLKSRSETGDALVCNHCDFETTCSKTFEKHKDSHYFKCTKCDFVTIVKYLFTKHMREIHNEVAPLKKKKFQFTCDTCRWTTQSKIKTLLHLIHHPNQPIDESTLDVSILRKYGVIV